MPQAIQLEQKIQHRLNSQVLPHRLISLHVSIHHHFHTNSRRKSLLQGAGLPPRLQQIGEEKSFKFRKQLNMICDKTLGNNSWSKRGKPASLFISSTFSTQCKPAQWFWEYGDVRWEHKIVRMLFGGTYKERGKTWPMPQDSNYWMQLRSKSS